MTKKRKEFTQKRKASLSAFVYIRRSLKSCSLERCIRKIGIANDGAVAVGRIAPSILSL